MSAQHEVMQQILQKIEEYDKIVITRHIRPDGDAVGSTKGLRGIIKLTYPQKDVRLLNGDQSQYLSFMGGDDEQPDDDFLREALWIVIDTAGVDRISNPKFSLAGFVIKIDHHIDNTPYGDISWVEDWRSSACEMIAFFYREFSDRLKMDTQTAYAIYCGMVTDSGRFRFESTMGETMRLAGMLLDFKPDIETLYSNLYLEEFDALKFQAHVFKKMKITEHGLCYVYVNKRMQKKFALTTEKASEAVSALKGIKGCIAQIAFIDLPNGTVRVRLRSRFMKINTLAEKYGGGGHECACGATLQSKKQIAAMVADGDSIVAEYKSTHEGWM